MNWSWNAEGMRAAAAMAAGLLFLCLAAGARAQQGHAFRSSAAMRARYARNGPHGTGPRNATLPYRNRLQNGAARPAPGYSPNQGRQNPAYTRPAYPNTARPEYAPPGHLGDWLSHHQGLPLQQQERLLRNNPGFDRLPQATQQRLVQQLHRLDQMPEPQRERRLARSEMLERMSPEEQMQVRQAGHQYHALQPGRQALVKQAFRDLRSVPLDQRDTVLDSQHYRNVFTPQERGILSHLLQAEPYEPPR